jgi:hypothetical protein
MGRIRGVPRKPGSGPGSLKMIDAFGAKKSLHESRHCIHFGLL